MHMCLVCLIDFIFVIIQSDLFEKFGHKLHRNLDLFRNEHKKKERRKRKTQTIKIIYYFPCKFISF